MTPQGYAQAMVERWEDQLGHRTAVPGIQRVTFTSDVKRRMVEDIMGLVADSIRRGRGDYGVE